MLREIAEHTGIEYTDVYANAARFDKKGSIGCGALVKKNLPIVSRYIAYLPGDEPRAAIQLELEKFVFIATDVYKRQSLLFVRARALLGRCLE